MKITGARTRIFSIPTVTRIALRTITSREAVVTEVETDEGITGLGYGFVFGLDRARALRLLVQDFFAAIEGDDPWYSEAIWQKMMRFGIQSGRSGLNVYAISILDTAVWDIKGKAAHLPLWKLLGGFREKVPCYASAGLWLNAGIPELQREAASFVEAGFKAVKVRVGLPDVQANVERVRAVRQVIGDKIDLMADANQGWTPIQAIEIGRRLQEFNLYWLEEPVVYDDYHGCARVAAALDVPICTGESNYTAADFRRYAELGAADYWMPDLQRIGGITELMKVFHLGESLGIPVTTHLFTEVMAHVMAAVSSPLYMEHMPWFNQLFGWDMQVDGESCLSPLPGPGLGLSLDPDAVARLQVD